MKIPFYLRSAKMLDLYLKGYIFKRTGEFVLIVDSDRCEKAIHILEAGGKVPIAPDGENVTAYIVKSGKRYAVIDGEP